MRMAFARPTETALGRFSRLLPAYQSLELIVLKGHLMIEEQLDRALVICAKHPHLLQDARLTFGQKVAVAHALGVLPASLDMWRFITALNTLRNRLSHRLEPGDVASEIDRIIAAYWQDEFVPPTTARRRATILRQALVMLVAMLHGFNEVSDELKNLGPKA